MKIIVAQTAGFCMGVKRAVDLAIDHAARRGALHTLGPLIHNRQTLDMLQARGVSVLDADTRLERITPGSGLLIRAHGVAPAVEERFTNAQCDVIDGTCPKVKTVQMVIKKYRERGFSVVISGDQGHAEVVGLQGYAGEACFLIQSEADVAALPPLDKICLVSQTTFDSRLFDAIAERMRLRFAGVELVVKKTICSATDRRQTETRQLAEQVDAVIVVGGRESANTARLAQVVRECGKKAFLVESEADIVRDDLTGIEIVGITAGASTPGWMIRRVFDHVEYLAHARARGVKNRIRQILDLAVNMNVFVSLGAASLLYASCTLQAIPFKLSGAVLACLYFFSMYLWNSLASIEITAHLGLNRYRFYRTHKNLLLGVSGLCMVLLLGISFTEGKALFALMAVATAAGAIYHVPIVPHSLRRLFRYRNLKDFPSSRDLFVAMAWAVVITFIPQIMQGRFIWSSLTVFCFAWFFFLSFIRSLMFDMRDIEGDRIMGRETLITIIGERRARIAIKYLIWAGVLVILLYPLYLFLFDQVVFRNRTLVLLLQLPVLIYIALFMWISRNNVLKQPAIFGVLADGPLYLSGLAAALIALFSYR